MKEFVESIKRLYISGALTKVKVFELYNNNKLTLQDLNYILDKT